MVDDLANITVERDLAILESTPPDDGSFSAMTGIQMVDNTLDNNMTPKMPMNAMKYEV